MATKKQVEANRRNAQKSTGPRTAEGKARSSRNAIKHGLSGRDCVISIEDRLAFEELRAELVREWSPATTSKLFLVNQMTDARWRIQRCRRMDTDTFERELDRSESATPSMSLVRCQENAAETFDRTRRYENSANSVWFRSINTLIKLQTMRRKLEDKLRTPPEPPEIIDEPEESASSRYTSHMDLYARAKAVPRIEPQPQSKPFSREMLLKLRPAPADKQNDTPEAA